MVIYLGGVLCALGIYTLGHYSFILGSLILIAVIIWQLAWFFHGGWLQEALDAEADATEQSGANFSFNINVDGENISGGVAVFRNDGTFEFRDTEEGERNAPPNELISLIESTLEVACDVLNDDFNVEFEHKLENGEGVISVKDYGDFEIGYCPRHNKFRYAYFETEVFSERNEPEYLKSLLTHFLSVK